MQGNTQEGLTQMQQFRANRSIGLDKAEWPIVYAFAVEAYGAAGQAEEGLGLVTEALALVEKAGFRFFEAELRRLQGELLLRQAAAYGRQAETCLHDALNLARRQQAKSLELRAAMSLSRLWHRQGKRKEAQRLLTEIYDWFTEGFDTADLQDARALLKELN
jgi:predicted ATPase